jgi:hypothetical protein
VNPVDSRSDHYYGHDQLAAALGVQLEEIQQIEVR